MSIVNALPEIAPTLRTQTLAKWPQGRMKMRNGRTVHWGLSSRPGDDSVELAWENITYAQAEQLCQIWDANYGIYGQLTLPADIFAGTSGGLYSLVAVPFPNTSWAFAGPPEVEAVKAGRCTVSIPIKTRGFVSYGT
jgi:hypothetical protein